MSTIDNRTYLDALRQRLGDVVTANDMERVLKVADDVLIDFDIHSVGQMGEDMDSEQLLEFYLMQLEVRGCAPGTIYGKKQKMEILLEFTGVPFRKIRAEHIMAFMQAERERGISQVTLDNDRHAFNMDEERGIDFKKPDGPDYADQETQCHETAVFGHRASADR